MPCRSRFIPEFASTMSAVEFKGDTAFKLFEREFAFRFHISVGKAGDSIQIGLEDHVSKQQW
jgi:hypothetical protein